MQRRKDKLRCCWTFWQDQWCVDPTTLEKKQTLSHLGDGDNVKDFYVLLNRHGINTIPPNSSLHIFRKHVRPEWEDKHNIDGGHLRVFANIQLGETPEMAAKRLSCLWFDVLRSIIGEHFEHADQVVGVGFTNKLHRPIMSVWLSTTDSKTTLSVRNDVFQLFSVAGASAFTARFYSHKGLAKNETGFKAEEVSWHRRIQSAPEAHVTVGDEEDDADVASVANSVRSAECSSVTPLNSPLKKSSSLRASPKRAVNCDSEGMSSPEKESPTSLLARRGISLSQANIVREHLRSRTESSAAEAIAAQPIKPTALAESHSGDFGIHVPSMAPTPIKDWTTDWSPSTFNAAQMQRSGNIAAAKTAALQNMFAAPSLQSVGVAPPRAIGLSPEVTQAAQRARRLSAEAQSQSNPPPPPLPVAPSPSVASTTTKPVIVDPNQLSDRKPFVCRGVAYPPRMNRKDYRAIIFNQTPNTYSYEGSFNAPPGTPDGDITCEEFEAMKAAFMLQAPLGA